MSDTDPLGLRTDAPVLDAYLGFLERSDTSPFTIPGHKQRTDLVGSVVRGDVPLHGGIDTVRLEGRVLEEAERRAARLWGADWCRFSVGGSTHGNQAFALAVAAPGATVVVSRTLHRSMAIGLVLAGLEPAWVRPRVDPGTGLPGAVDAGDLRAVLERHPDAAAVFVGDPSYAGAVGDVAALARLAHDHGAPLVVDAAWGAHFGFHPSLPAHALSQGADAIVTSAHKTLPAVSQGALVLARTDRLDPDRLLRAFDATHTTSPSGAVLASIDASRALLEHHGEPLLARLVDLVAAARARLAAVPGLTVVGGDAIDPTKLVVQLHGRGIDGYRLEARLIDAGLPVEMADRDTVVPIVTIADDARTVDRLVSAIVEAVERLPRGRPRPPTVAVWSVEPTTVLSPRDAFFAPHTTIDCDAAVGRICAELVAPYPPGVPVLAPGELVTADALAALRRARDEGARIAYAADPTLATVQVVAR
jgi:arginine decarboxylase